MMAAGAISVAGVCRMICHARARRRSLRQRFNVKRQFELLEETCIPSYLHANPLAAALAWYRLFYARKLYHRYAPTGPILDFGAASGEFGFLVPAGMPYDFVEIDENMALELRASHPGATRRNLDELPASHYSVVVALDSLEHNEDIEDIVARIVAAMSDESCLIVSGPTENLLYRAGRKIAGFRGDYHKVTIYDIERVLRRTLAPVTRSLIPFGFPLFALSAWRKRGDGSRHSEVWGGPRPSYGSRR